MPTVVEWTGREARLLREALLLTQRGFAERLGLGPSTVTDWENQDVAVRLRKSSKQRLDAELASAPRAARERFEQALARGRGQGPESAAVLPGTGQRHVDLVAVPSAQEAPAVGTQTASDIGTVRMLREADSRIGGGYLYTAVTGYLQNSLAPRLFGELGGSPGQNPITSAATMTEMAGWMAHDAGQHDLAVQHLGRALSLAKASAEHQLTAHVLGSLSHLALHQNQPSKAVTLARQGQERLAAAPNAEVDAWLLALQARGHAALHQHADVVSRLNEAELVHAAGSHFERSPWVRQVDTASLAVEIARASLACGDLQRAEEYARRVMPLRPPGRVRSRAFAQLIQLKSHIRRGRADEACAIGRNTLNEATALSSRLVLEELRDVARMLLPHQDRSEVKDFLQLLNEHIRQHLWLLPGHRVAGAPLPAQL